MAEKIIWIAKCKLRGMNQRVGIVYDDTTLQVFAIRSVGRGIGELTVKLFEPGKSEIIERLAHKADSFDMISLRSDSLFLIRNNGEINLPSHLKIQCTWRTR